LTNKGLYIYQSWVQRSSEKDARLIYIGWHFEAVPYTLWMQSSLLVQPLGAFLGLGVTSFKVMMPSNWKLSTFKKCVPQTCFFQRSFEVIRKKDRLLLSLTWHTFLNATSYILCRCFIGEQK